MIETKIKEDYKIQIPKEIYNTLQISSDDKLLWEIIDEKIVITVKKEKKLKNKTISFLDDEEIESYKI